MAHVTNFKHEINKGKEKVERADSQKITKNKEEHI